MIFLLTIGLVLLLLLGLPVALAVGISALGSILISSPNFNFSSISQIMQSGLQTFVLLAIPLFIFAAKIMNKAGITDKIFSFASALVGFFPGGLANANVVASLIFAGMSGAAVSDAIGLGQIEINAMTKRGYSKSFSVAVTAASSIIGPIFPPSIPMVIFSFVSGVSVGRLFLGGVIPGIMMTVILMIMVILIAKKNNMPREAFPTFAKAIRIFKDAFFPLLTPIILLGGIWLGIFTPTEAAAVAALYALILGIFFLRIISLKDLVQVLVETARETAIMGFIVAGATLYGYAMMRSGITIKTAEWIGAISQNPLIILLIINIFLIVVGCFLDPVVAILILGPIFMPIIEVHGINPVHFGVLMVLNLMIGLLTPPFGFVLFVMTIITDLKFKEVVKAVFPFLFPLILILVLITIFPAIVTTLPDLLIKVP